jgi:hypothetical protein
VLAQARKFKQIVHDQRKIHFPPVLAHASLPYLAGLEYLLDSAQQPISVFEHYAIEVAPLSFVEWPAFERL